MNKQNQIITSDYTEIQHLKFSEITAFRVKNGVYWIILKDSK